MILILYACQTVRDTSQTEAADLSFHVDAKRCGEKFDTWRKTLLKPFQTVLCYYIMFMFLLTWVNVNDDLNFWFNLLTIVLDLWNCLVCRKRKAPHIFSKPSYCLFYLTKCQKPKYIQFKVMFQRGRQNIFTFESHEPVCLTGWTLKKNITFTETYYYPYVKLCNSRTRARTNNAKTTYSRLCRTNGC